MNYFELLPNIYAFSMLYNKIYFFIVIIIDQYCLRHLLEYSNSILFLICIYLNENNAIESILQTN